VPGKRRGAQPAKWGWIAACLTVVLATPAASQSREADSTARGCRGTPTVPPRLGEDSVSDIRLFVTLGELASICPGARDTSFSGNPDNRGRRREYPALALNVAGLRLLGVQYRNSQIDRTQPADGWIVFGTNAELSPSLTPLASGWGALWPSLGDAQANNRGLLVVKFCSLPRMLFTMDADSTTLERLGDPVDLAAIPSTTKVHHILILSPVLGRALHPC
jgi:hypothetical protein